MIDVIFFLISIAFYYAIHSLLAADVMKRVLYLFIPKRFYRIFYNVISIVLLIPITLAYLDLSLDLLFNKTILTNLIGWGAIAVGALLLVGALRQYNLSEFSGLNTSTVALNSKLNMSGLNAWVRHPLYSGILVLLIGLVLIQPNVAIIGMAIISLVYILIGIQLEEKKLINEFGASYINYRSEVGMLIPKRFPSSQ